MVEQGNRYGRLIALRRLAHKSNAGCLWECRCDCGALATVAGIRLTTKRTKSCGCLKRDLGRERCKKLVTHGHTMGGKVSKEYNAWRAARSRCTNPKDRRFSDYGGRGVQMCPEWLHNFAGFFSDMGRCPPGLTLDRINNDGNYEPGNCRWATWSEQNNNRRPKTGKANPVAPVATMKPQSETRQAKAQRQIYWERVRNGRCHKCGNERGEKRTDRTTCRTCGKNESARVKASYYRRRSNNEQSSSRR